MSQRLFWPIIFKECFMHYWIHYDRQAQVGDLRRMQIITSDELSLAEDLRGPYNKLEDALKSAKSLIKSVVAKTLDRLRTEKPRSFATFPTSSQTTKE
jgi:hypothetical protein